MTEPSKTSATPIIYITRDFERALPLIKQKSDFIITNSSTFAKKIAKKNRRIILISEDHLLDTSELLRQSSVSKLINSYPGANLVVFKNTALIENICRMNGWKLLNPPASLSAKIEEKISQVEWLKDLSHLLPPHQIINGSKIKFSGRPFIAQFNRSHTGSGTFLINSTKIASEISSTFPNRPVRISKFIEGPVFTSNVVVSVNRNILLGPISYQITGLKPFTNNDFATIGNDWALPNKILSKQHIIEFTKIAQSVGKKLSDENWRGLFGIDVILDTVKNKIYLLEINARQPASTTFESELQSDKKSTTTFDLHLMALLQKELNQMPTNISNGAQIILRVPDPHEPKDLSKIIKILEKSSFKTILYPNQKPGNDLLRIMSKKGIMSNHNRFNKTGKKIVEIIEKYG
jgi:hypothetical protein